MNGYVTIEAEFRSCNVLLTLQLCPFCDANAVCSKISSLFILVRVSKCHKKTLFLKCKNFEHHVNMAHCCHTYSTVIPAIIQYAVCITEHMLKEE